MKSHTLFMADFQCSDRGLLFDKMLPWGKFRHTGGSLNNFRMKVHFLSFLLSLRCSTASDWVILSFSLLWIYFCTLLAFPGNKTWDSLVFLWNTLKKYCSFLRPKSERHYVKVWNCIHLYLYCEVFHALRINHILS